MGRPCCLVSAVLLAGALAACSSPSASGSNPPSGGSGGGGVAGSGGAAGDGGDGGAGDGGGDGGGGDGGGGGSGGEPCAPDGTRNGAETDVDCGGGCDPCDDGLACLVGADCRSGVCDHASSRCAAPACGDGVVNGGDACDDGNDVEGDGCDSNCTVSACGNGILAGPESCDDGNAADGDGCSVACGVEPGWVCKGGACAPLETVCNDGVDDNGAFGIDGADPSCQLPGWTPSCMPGLVRRVLRSDVVVPLPDGDFSGVTSSLPLAAGAATISQAMVSFTIDHPLAEDLDVYLVAPSGVEFELSTDNGGGGPGYLDVVLSAACSAPVTSGTAPFSACYYPENLLGGLNGTAASGTWGLRVADDASGDVGTLRGWRLVLCTPS